MAHMGNMGKDGVVAQTNQQQILVLLFNLAITSKYYTSYLLFSLPSALLLIQSDCSCQPETKGPLL